MTYEKMTAQELHDLVERLEAHGFKAPEGIQHFSQDAPSPTCWLHNGQFIATPFAAAIIEVAARDWWLNEPRVSAPGNILSVWDCGARAANDYDDNESPSKPTPLHAILAAVEAETPS